VAPGLEPGALRSGIRLTATKTLMAEEISFRVDGYPPAKGEAISMLGPTHSHAPRVRVLLEMAREAMALQGLPGFGSGPLGMELIVRCARDGNRSDATNYLGGVGDTLESKDHRGGLEHLGHLADVALYDNDRQIEEVRYRWEESSTPSYRVRFWSLADAG